MDKQKLIIVGGSLATGKSTMAKRLADQTKIVRVSMDEIKENLFDVVGYRDRAWSQEIGRVAFPVFKGVIEMYLERGESVIADAVFICLDDVEWIERFASDYNVELVQVWMTADPRVCRERFVGRASGERHPGHNDELEHVIEEFDRRFFNKTFIPLPLDAKTKIVDTTDFDAVDHDEILNWI
jgi:predicted kinase